MSKVTFLNDNKVLKADITLLSGSADAQFPLSNIKHDFSTKVFRSNSSTVEIMIDLKEITEVDIVALKGSSVDGIGFSSATIEGSATPVFSGIPEAINISHAHNFAFKELATSSLRYWKITLTGTGFVELSNVFIGKKIQMMDNNLSLGFSYTRVTNNKVTKNAYGQRFIDTYNSANIISGEVKYANSAEFDLLNNVHVTHGENSPVWFMLDADGRMDTESSEFMFSGMFYMRDLVWKNVAPGLWDVSLVLEEAM